MAKKRKTYANGKVLPILGFRSNKTWKKVIALFYYIPMLIILFAALIDYKAPGAETVLGLGLIGLAIPVYIGIKQRPSIKSTKESSKGEASKKHTRTNTASSTNMFSEVEKHQGREKNTKAVTSYTDVILSGDLEKKESISPRKATSSAAKDIFSQPRFTVAITPTGQKNSNIEDAFDFDIEVSHSYTYSQDKFLRDMKKYADKDGSKAPFVPFSQYWPTYDSMTPSQQRWYFYWRTQVRNGNYLKTDLSYIFVHVYELLNGCGWKEANDGYEQLQALWISYRGEFPQLDNYLIRWTFDFAYLHGLEYAIPDFPDIRLPSQLVALDVLIDQHSAEKPLKLSFAMIDALCDYSLVSSKFYIDGHQLLMQEAIPRVVALADAALLKQKGKGILAVYGPNRTRKQSFYVYQGAVCPGANKRVELSVKAYTSNSKLRSYINELVRYAENVLRGLYGSRGRLRGVALDEESARLVEAFLKKEYAPSKKAAHTHIQDNTVKLNFENIEALRIQSEAVRDALEVPEEVENAKPLLTDLQEVSDLMGELSHEALILLDALYEASWECTLTSSMSNQIEEINRLANRYLACALLMQEHGRLIVEDDYRDELDYIYEHRDKTVPKDNITTSEEDRYFDISKLSAKMQQLFEMASVIQKKIIHAVLMREDSMAFIEQIAEEELSMPEILIDEINDLATQVLDDILIDAFGDTPVILEQYESELKNALK